MRQSRRSFPTLLRAQLHRGSFHEKGRIMRISSDASFQLMNTVHLFAQSMQRVIHLICVGLLCGSLGWETARAEEPQNIPISELGSKYELIGKLHSPLGHVISIQGIAVEGPFKGYEGGPNLRVQGIGWNYTQEDIQIVIKPLLQEWGVEATAGGATLPKLEMGQTYEMEGYETGGFEGVPGDTFKRGAALVQSVSYYFRHHFIVTKAKRIEPITYSPLMFTGKKALIGGVAETKDGNSTVVADGWKVIVTRGSAWPSDVEGKQIETYGLYNPDSSWRSNGGKASGNFDLLEGTWHLVRLEDQLGKKVSLRGRARSHNGVWWFNYRGQDLYVEGIESLPGWTDENHWRPMIIEGRLDKAKLPRLDQVSRKPDRELADYFIVREASWKPLPELLFPERQLRPNDD